MLFGNFTNARVLDSEPKLILNVVCIVKSLSSVFYGDETRRKILGVLVETGFQICERSSVVNVLDDSFVKKRVDTQDKSSPAGVVKQCHEILLD